MHRNVLIAALVFLALVAITSFAVWQYRIVLASRYEALRAGQVHGAKWLDVDRQTFEDWIAAIKSSDRKTMRTTSDAFSESFKALPDAGFSADIDGYLRLRAADLPAPETLSIFELSQWCNAAGLRVLLGRTASDAPLYVYRKDGLVRGFRLPNQSRTGVLHLGILENGSYAEYLSQPNGLAEDDSIGD